jgi:hypothetical protein
MMAYVTFLGGGGDDLKGVVGLAMGLRKVGSAYPLVVAVLPGLPVEHRCILVSQGCTVREVEPAARVLEAPHLGGTVIIKQIVKKIHCNPNSMSI